MNETDSIRRCGFFPFFRRFCTAVFISVISFTTIFLMKKLGIMIWNNTPFVLGYKLSEL
jgi:hypothetical protein